MNLHSAVFVNLIRPEDNIIIKQNNNISFMVSEDRVQFFIECDDIKPINREGMIPKGTVIGSSKQINGKYQAIVNINLPEDIIIDEMYYFDEEYKYENGAVD